MSDTLTIAVVCPVFNSASFISPTIESILSQTLPPSEVLFCDDGSTDNSVAIIESFRSKFQAIGIRLEILNAPHKGPGAARNLGIRHSTSLWISFLDSDDLWSPDKLEVVIDNIQRNPNANLISNWERLKKLNGEAVTIQNAARLENNTRILNEIFLNNGLSPSAVTCQRQLLLKVGGFAEDLPVSQDYELWIRLAVAGLNICCIREVLGTYVERPGNITSRSYAWKFPYLLSIINRHRYAVPRTIWTKKLFRITVSIEWIKSNKFFNLFKNQRFSI